MLNQGLTITFNQNLSMKFNHLVYQLSLTIMFN
jgi:hypothetical protein